MALIVSRTFELEIDGEHKTCLIPYADMLNHRSTEQVKWFYDEEQKGFVIKALEDIPKGAEVYDTYGKGNNMKLFLTCGFMNKETDEDQVQLQLSIDNKAQDYQQKTNELDPQCCMQNFGVEANL